MKVQPQPHPARVVRPQDAFQAKCRCGWQGPVRARRGQAQQDAADHINEQERR